MTNPGIDIDGVIGKIIAGSNLTKNEAEHFALCIRSICLRVEQVATKAERERCASIVENSVTKEATGDGLGTWLIYNKTPRQLRDEILNGEAR